MSFVYAGGIEQVLCCGKQQLLGRGLCAHIYTRPWREEERERQGGKKERVRREEEEGGRQDPEDKIGGGAR